MKTFIFGILVLLLVCLSSRVEAVQCVITAVVDGDTVKGLCAGEPSKIRLYGIDTPEIKQPFGIEAKAFVKAFLKVNNPVNLEQAGADRYGRTIGIITAGKKNLNLELVKAGLAWVYTRYCQKKAFCERLIYHETKARQNRAGLFSDESPVEPWIFRRR